MHLSSPRSESAAERRGATRRADDHGRARSGTRSFLLVPVLDGALEWFVAAFALWTVLYHLASATGWGALPTWVVWIVGAVAIAILRVRLRTVLRRGYPPAADVAAAVVALGFAVLSAVMVRPDLDDASYMVRARWVQGNDVLAPGDVIFSDNQWDALVGQSPYLASFEAMLGMLARSTGIPVGTLTYVLVVPVASAAAVWALWTLLRAWRVRRPLQALLLACVFLLWGGATHASWGNLGIGRIWQGKVVLLAVLVPLLLAWCARYWQARGTRRGAVLVLVVCGSVAGVGLTSAAVFVVPGLVVVGALLGLVTRRVLPAAVLVVAGAAYPLGAGVVTRLFGNMSTDSAVVASAGIGAWERTLGTGVPLWVVAVAAVAALSGLVPALARTEGVIGALTAAAAVLVGALIAVPAVWELMVRVMGTDAIAWRLAWVVPVPVLVGMLASPTRRGPRWTGLAGGAVVAVLLVAQGVPLWSSTNGVVQVGAPAWKLPPQDLETARWVVDHPPDGRYAAPLWVTTGVGVLSSELLPVGSRSDYLASYTDDPEARVPERLALQNWVDGVAVPAELALVPDALVSLDVALVCGPDGLAATALAGWTESYVGPTHTCWTRP